MFLERTTAHIHTRAHFTWHRSSWKGQLHKSIHEHILHANVYIKLRSFSSWFKNRNKIWTNKYIIHVHVLNNDPTVHARSRYIVWSLITGETDVQCTSQLCTKSILIYVKCTMQNSQEAISYSRTDMTTHTNFSFTRSSSRPDNLVPHN